MKLSELYKIIIEKGIKHDPRGRMKIRQELIKRKQEYSKLTKKGKAHYDPDNLFNPYADTRIIHGDIDSQIYHALVGIDIGVGEILLADRINSKNKGRKIDLCISHHPEGRAWANFYEVMNLQVDIYSNMGISVNVAEGLLQERKAEVARKVHAANHTQAADAARLLDTNLLCMHTPADNLVNSHLRNLFNKYKPQKVKGIIDILNSIPEYKIALRNNAGPKIVLGQEDKKAGKIIVEMTGGTEGPKKILDYYPQAGIGTIVCMHLSEEHFKYAQKDKFNIIVAGHIASDNIGLNLMLDEIQKNSPLDITCCSGFNRVKRSK